MATTGTTKATTACRTSRFMPSTLHPICGYTLGHLNSQLSHLCNFEPIAFLLPYHVASIHRLQEQGQLFRPWAVSGKPSIHTYQVEHGLSIWHGPDACRHEIEAERASDMCVCSDFQHRIDRIAPIAWPRIEFQLTALILRW